MILFLVVTHRSIYTYIIYITIDNRRSIYSWFSSFSWRRGPVTELEPSKLIMAMAARDLGFRTVPGGGSGDGARSIAV